MILPNNGQLGVMLMQLSSCLMLALQHVEQRKNKIRYARADNGPPLLQPQAWCTPYLVAAAMTLLSSSATMMRLWYCDPAEPLARRRVIFNILKLALGGIIKYLYFLHVCRFILKQLELVNQNIWSVKDFVAKTLPGQQRWDEEVCSQPWDESWSSSESSPRSEIPLPVLSRSLKSNEAIKAWWAHWCSLRMDFVAEQFGLDALVGLAGVNILNSAVYMLINWLTFQESEGVRQVAFLAWPAFWCFMWSIVFSYLYGCMKVNDISNMLDRIDELISTEAEGTPHTLLGQRITWSLILSSFAPLLIFAHGQLCKASGNPHAAERSILGRLGYQLVQLHCFVLSSEWLLFSFQIPY